MIYRDDDISKYTDLTTILNIQKLFDKYNKVHTVTLLLEDLWESRGVWEFITTTPNLNVALHGWVHEDFSCLTLSEIEDRIRKCLSYWKINTDRMNCNKKITTFFPPWNRINNDGIQLCNYLGLEVNINIDIKEVYNFHWWSAIHPEFLKELETKLKEN